MRRVSLSFAALLIASVARAQPTNAPGANRNLSNLTYTYTVANLPSAPTLGQQAYVTDGSTGYDCTVGGGSSKVPCIYNGAAWVVHIPGTLPGSVMPALTGDVNSSVNTVSTTVVATHLASPGPIAQGFTGASTAAGAFNNLSGMSAQGDTIFGGSAGSRAILAGNTTTTRKFYRETGDGVNAGTPSWDILILSDIPTNPNVVTSAAALTNNQLLGGAGGQGAKVVNLTGDITTSGGLGTTLATVNSGPGTCGDSTHVCQVTVNAKGLVTAQAQIAIPGTSSGTYTTYISTFTSDGTSLYVFAAATHGLGAHPTAFVSDAGGLVIGATQRCYSSGTTFATLGCSDSASDGDLVIGPVAAGNYSIKIIP